MMILIALILLGVYVPQTIFVPLIQRAINRRAQARIATLREASAGVIEGHDGERRPDHGPARRARRSSARQRALRAALHTFLVLTCLVWLSPLLWAVYTSLRPIADHQRG